MNFLLIVPHYISWHYTKGVSDLIALFKNLVWFIWNFFSVQILLQTLFVPFQKLSVKSTKRFDIEGFFSALVTNLLMRVVGFFVRGLFIVMGIFSLVVFVLGFAVFFLIWMAMPLLLVSIFVLGIYALFKFPQV